MIVICENQDCVNFGIPIEFAEPTDEVTCGPCGQQITNIQEK